jgi:hypothetical protein
MPRPFTWSYSRLKNFENCPKKHYELDIAKNIKEEEGESLLWGNYVHKHMALACGPTRAPLPDQLAPYQKYVDRLVTSPGNILVEQKLALMRNFGACEFFAPAVWFRGIGDVIKINGSVALTGDWKTGKILEDSVQLALTAACIFAKFPEVKKIRSVFWWLKEDCETVEDFTPADMPGLWRALWPRIEAMEHAHNTTTYQAKPSGLCKHYCPVTSCPHHGKGAYG